MLSVGSGICSHELKFAKYHNFKEIICVDIVEYLLKKAAKHTKKESLENIKFWCEDILELDFEPHEFDMIMFNSSLHHFSNVEDLIKTKIKKWLKPEGILLINEYVGANRLQFNKEQILIINTGLKLIPKHLRQRFKSTLIKNRFYGSGYIKMIIADPSECIESENILPTVRSEFKVIEEKAIGGNLLMNILKDISHNFVNIQDAEVNRTLQKLFTLEDEFLEKHESDFIFGLYRN